MKILEAFLFRMILNASLKKLILVVVGIFFFGALIMPLAEPSDSALQHFGNYSWWFTVSITGTGYGDIVPVTRLGRLMAGIVMWTGYLGITMYIISKLFTIAHSEQEKRMKGLVPLNLKNHTVIFGNRGDETLKLVESLKNDKEASQEPVVLCSMLTTENPFPDEVDFVHGELTSDDVMVRACVADADRIIVHSDTDQKSIIIANAVRYHNPTATVVINLDNPDNEVHLHRIGVGNKVACVKPMNVPMIVREITNPGITRQIEGLLGNTGQEFYSLTVPSGAREQTFGELAANLLLDCQSLLYAVVPNPKADTEAVINPGTEFVISPGMKVSYMAVERLSPQQISEVFS